MEPERPIEQLLRKAAQARRAQAGAPEELHPANRRMLQSEVARKFASAPKKQSFLDSLTLFMPRLAWGAALVVGLGLAASLMLPRQNTAPRKMFFAKNERAPSVQSANEAKVPSTPVPKTTALSEMPALAKADDARRAGDSEIRRQDAGRAPAELTLADREKDSLSVEHRAAESQKNQTLALNAPAPVSAASAGGSLAVTKQKEELVMNSNGANPEPITPAPDSNLLQRRYGLVAPAQARSSSAVSSVSAGLAGSPAAQSRDEAANTELAYKSLPQSTSAGAAPTRGVQLKTVPAADTVKKSPAPIARVSQQYVQSEPLKKGVEFELADKSDGAKAILASFELEQIGREVRIVDSDGSVYSGSFQSPQTSSHLDSSMTQKAAAARSLQPTAPQAEQKGALYDSKLSTDLGYFFTVSGTNQSLNQKIVFMGQIFASTNTATLTGQMGTASGNRIGPPELSPLPLLSSRISGKAIIGTNKEVEVNAIPAH